MSRSTVTLGIASLVLLTRAMFAGPLLTPCPSPNGGNSGGEGVSSTYTGDFTGSNGCNVLITFNADGSITTTYPDAAPSYDSGGDDNLIGIINNTSSAITSLSLSSTTDDIFGFDGDGICGSASTGASQGTPGYTFVGGGNPCVNATSDPNGYGGPYVSYSNISGNDQSGVVNFGNGGIASMGGSTFFSLEGPVDVNLQVGPGTPEPGTFLLLGGGCLALAFFRRRAAR